MWRWLNKQRVWPAFVRSVKDLAAFRRIRGGFVPAAGHGLPKVRRIWSMAGVTASDVNLLQELISSSRRIEDLASHPGWNDLLEAKQYYQSLADWKTKTPTLTEKERFQAAVEWATLEGFFKEVYGRIRRGREAEAKVRKVVRV